jgi:TPR repeat protein
MAAEGRLDRALKYYLLAAEYGHAGACFECGVMYEHGVPGLLEPDLRQAVLNYMMATIGGFPAARYNLAFMYERGLGGLKPSVDRSLQLFDAAAELGHDRAAAALAERLFQGVVRDKSGGGGVGLPAAAGDEGAPLDFTDEAIFYWVLAARMVKKS